MSWIDGKERVLSALSLLACAIVILCVVHLIAPRVSMATTGGMVVWITFTVVPILATWCVTILLLNNRKQRIREGRGTQEEQRTADRSFGGLICRLGGLGFLIDTNATAPRPNNIGSVQVVSGYQVCEHFSGRIGVELTEIVDVNGVPTRNNLGRACTFCGVFQENLDALCVGSLAKSLLGRKNLFEVLDELEAGAGIRQDRDSDDILARREQELKSELGKIQTKRQAFAFANGQPLEPAEPYRGE